MNKISRARWWIAGLVLVAFIAVGAWLAAGGVESQLETDVRDALAQAGIDVDDVEADGRSVTLTGPGFGALQVAQDVDGVREVSVREPDSATPAPPTEPADPTRSSGPTSTATPTTAPLPTSPATSAPTITTTTTTTPRTTTPSTTSTTAAPTPTTRVTAPPPRQEVELVEALGVVAFEDDDPDEPTPASKRRLDEVAELLEDSPDLRISLVGHVPDGTADADELSLARAWAVAGYLEWRGIPFERMEVSGAGSELALDDLDPDDPKNARIELRVIEGA